MMEAIKPNGTPILSEEEQRGIAERALGNYHRIIAVVCDRKADYRDRRHPAYLRMVEAVMRGANAHDVATTALRDSSI